MMTRDDALLNFLQEDVKSARLDALVAHLNTRREQLFTNQHPNLIKLSERRILSSNSLLRSQADRGNWDKGNVLIGQWLSEEVSFSMDALRKLHAALTGTSSELRLQAVYGGGDAYLGHERIAEAVQLLDVRLKEIEEPLIRAAWLYIWVINVHPFADGNGRTARLATDWQLMSEGYAPLCFRSNIEGHVAYAQAERFRTLEESILKCLAGVEHSFDILFS